MWRGKKKEVIDQKKAKKYFAVIKPLLLLIPFLQISHFLKNSSRHFNTTFFLLLQYPENKRITSWLCLVVIQRPVPPSNPIRTRVQSILTSNSKVLLAIKCVAIPSFCLFLYFLNCLNLISVAIRSHCASKPIPPMSYKATRTTQNSNKLIKQ